MEGMEAQTSPYGPGQSWQRLGSRQQPRGDSDGADHEWLQLDVRRGWSCTTHLMVLKRA